jgi:tetratricopeptide (TPR) repeat protein
MDDRFKGRATDRLVNDCLDAGEMDRVRGTVRSDGLTQLCPATLGRLVDSGLITADQSEAEDKRRLQLVASLGENPGPNAIIDVLDPTGLPLHAGPELWFIRADALSDLGRFEEALEDLDTCARLFPAWSSQALLRAEVLFKVNRFRDAISVLSRHADEFASNPGAQNLLARSYGMLGDFDRAIAVCEVALAQQEHPGLRQLLEKALALGDRYREPLYLFAWLVLAGSFAEARKIWNENVRGTLSAAGMAAAFRVVVNEKNLPFLRTLIRESRLDDELLPLAVAMDYLETGDRSPLEKLSAEVRPIAEEIVAELQKKLSKPEQAMGAKCT